MLISTPFPDKEAKEHKEEDNSSTVIHQNKKNVGLDTYHVFQPALVFNVAHFASVLTNIVNMHKFVVAMQ